MFKSIDILKVYRKRHHKLMTVIFIVGKVAAINLPLET